MPETQYQNGNEERTMGRWRLWPRVDSKFETFALVNATLLLANDGVEIAKNFRFYCCKLTRRVHEIYTLSQHGFMIWYILDFAMPTTVKSIYFGQREIGRKHNKT